MNAQWSQIGGKWAIKSDFKRVFISELFGLGHTFSSGVLSYRIIDDELIYVHTDKIINRSIPFWVSGFKNRDIASLRNPVFLRQFWSQRLEEYVKHLKVPIPFYDYYQNLVARSLNHPYKFIPFFKTLLFSKHNRKKIYASTVNKTYVLYGVYIN